MYFRFYGLLGLPWCCWGRAGELLGLLWGLLELLWELLELFWACGVAVKVTLFDRIGSVCEGVILGGARWKKKIAHVREGSVTAWRVAR